MKNGNPNFKTQILPSKSQIPNPNIKLGLKARAKEGKWNGERIPFGYKYNGNEKFKDFKRGLATAFF